MITLIFEPRTIGVLAPRTRQQHYELITLRLQPDRPYHCSWDQLELFHKNKVIGHLVCDLTVKQIPLRVHNAFL